MPKKKTFQECLLMGYVCGSNNIHSLKGKCKRFIRRNDGVTAVEYAIVVAGVAAIVIFIFGTSGPVRSMLNNTFTDLGTKVTSLINGTGGGGGGGGGTP